MIGKIFLWFPPPTYWTHSWTEQALPWAVRVTGLLLENHRLNMKYWVVVRESTIDSTAKKILFICNNPPHHARSKKCSSQRVAARGQHLAAVGSLSARWRASRTLPWASLRGGGQKWEAEVQDREKDKWGGGRASEPKSGGWKQGRCRKVWRYCSCSPV